MGIPERRERERQQRRRAILEAAQRVFFQHGYRNATMEMVAAEAELGKATLYEYFHTKEELYVALLEDGLRLFDAMMAQASQEAAQQPVRQAIHTFARQYWRFANEYPEYFVLLMHVSTAIELPLEKVRSELLAELQQLQERAVLRGMELVQRGIQEGIFPPGVVPGRVLAEFWVVLSGALLLARHPYRMRLMQEVKPEELVEELVELLLCGWQCRAQSSLVSSSPR
ncbi:MAG: TetR/AcrR family transcriptional regulator [Candidatus Kapabacteria bacterium]|nr:TetR/AcrR family transcriptional regulator [Candidatus Kapabacteria bacterium]MDW8012039.1 TetR/AcrR family transcriptional regulator [Bacteroidota bacterium]